MRVFVALPLPEDLRDMLAGLQAGLRAGRATDPEQMHVTLAFIPEVGPGALGDFNDALEGIRAYPFDVAFRGLDLFGDANRPRLLAAMIRPSQELDQLHRDVHGAARAAGLSPHRQKFRPHVTLARFAPRTSPNVAADIQNFLSARATVAIPGFVAEGITLTRSTLGGGPPVYDELADYPFRPLPGLEWRDDD